MYLGNKISLRENMHFFSKEDCQTVCWTCIYDAFVCAQTHLENESRTGRRKSTVFSTSFETSSSSEIACLSPRTEHSARSARCAYVSMCTILSFSRSSFSKRAQELASSMEFNFGILSRIDLSIEALKTITPTLHIGKLIEMH